VSNEFLHGGGEYLTAVLGMVASSIASSVLAPRCRASANNAGWNGGAYGGYGLALSASRCPSNRHADSGHFYRSLERYVLALYRKRPGENASVMTGGSGRGAFDTALTLQVRLSEVALGPFAGSWRPNSYHRCGIGRGSPNSRPNADARGQAGWVGGWGRPLEIWRLASSHAASRRAADRELRKRIRIRRTLLEFQPADTNAI
jgi:hypothetical protein